MSVTGPALQELLNAFRTHYRRYENAVHEAFQNAADSVVLWRLGDDLDQYLGLINESHQGRPAVVETIRTGAPGRPSVEINPDFLRWAYSLRSTASIARFLGLGRSVVRRALIEHGIAIPRQQPATLAALDNNNEPTSVPTDEYLVNPEQATPPAAAPSVSSFTGPLSDISDDELDDLLIRLRTHFRRAGITMFDGMLRRLGHHVPRERIRQALIRVDPVQRVFQRITIRRRTYHVPGPNSLWHHDGQHGSSVHNVRIERLWADITAQIGATWSEMFTVLEVRHGLDINNVCHIWLLHYLFLHQINEQLRFFMEAWNQHQIRIRDGPNRSPADMFGFDMHVHGVRGTDPTPMSNEELEVYGVDWEALHDDSLLESRQENNPPDEDSTSWIGRRGPPERLNEVAVEPPAGPFSPSELQLLEHAVGHLAGAVEDIAVANLWTEALIAARRIRSDLF
ncbi:hypothetical protein DFH06DRAFT_1009844 [Mycena polygramma]|nr:hypothetical protein DFH06DRAFT_1009844 [Mycena polygramma]